jgi:hypothetical protein
MAAANYMFLEAIKVQLSIGLESVVEGKVTLVPITPVITQQTAMFVKKGYLKIVKKVHLKEPTNDLHFKNFLNGFDLNGDSGESLIDDFVKLVNGE